MKNPEFSAQFDVLYNNITSNQAPGLDEYEKSVFLTKGQDEVIKNYFSPKGNPKQDGFDDSPKRQHDFSTLVQTKDLEPLVENISGGVGVFDHRGLDYIYQSDIFLVLNEQLYNKTTNFIYTINPISFDEYNRLMQKPYKYPPKNQVWRLMITNDVPAHTETITEIVEEEVEYPGKGDFSISDEARSLLSSSAWRNAKISAEAKDTSDYSVSIIVSNEYREELTESEYFTQCPPTVGGNIAIILPDVMNLSTVYEYLNSSQYKSKTYTNTTIWDHLSSLEFPTETSTMQEELRNYGENDLKLYYFDLYAETRTEKRVVTREITIPEAQGRISELIGRWYGSTDDLVYRVRYVKRPQPIILVNLDTDNVEDGLGFEYAGQVLTSETPCELPESLHSEVLQRAVELAKIAWQGETQAIVTSGQRSE